MSLLHNAPGASMTHHTCDACTMHSCCLWHKDSLFAVPTAAQDMCHEPAVYTRAQLCGSHKILRVRKTTETTIGKEKTKPFGVTSTRIQVVYRAAQTSRGKLADGSCKRFMVRDVCTLGRVKPWSLGASKSGSALACWLVFLISSAVLEQ